MGEPRPTISSRQWVARIGIAVLVGVAVTATAILAAWQRYAPTRPLNDEQFFTRVDLDWMRNALGMYLRDNGTLPLTLPDPKKVNSMVLRTDGNSSVVDAWGHDLIYQHDGNHFVVTSLGRDGKPGGVGLDCDLSTTAPWPPGAHPTLRQFFFDLPTGGIVVSCVFGGVLALILTLLVLRTPRQGEPKPAIIAVKIAFTFIGAAMIACILAFLHVPWGH